MLGSHDDVLLKDVAVGGDLVGLLLKELAGNINPTNPLMSLSLYKGKKWKVRDDVKKTIY